MKRSGSINIVMNVVLGLVILVSGITIGISTAVIAFNYREKQVPAAPASRWSAGAFEQITDLSSATGITVPAGTKSCDIFIEGANVRYRDDGTAPTASVGMRIAAGDWLINYDGPMGSLPDS